MSQVKATEIEGDVSIGRHITAGGNATIRGNVVVNKNFVVEGWLEAKNIKGVNKGLFETAGALRESYPEPDNGWYALVAEGLPDSGRRLYLGQLYAAEGGRWVAQWDDEAKSIPRPGGSESGVTDALKDELVSELGKLDTKVSGVEAHAMRLDADVSEVSETVLTHERVLSGYDQILGSHKQQLESQNSDIARLSQEVKGIDSSLDSALSDVYTEIAETQNKVFDAQSAVETAQSAAESAQSAAAKAQSEAESRSSDIVIPIEIVKDVTSSPGKMPGDDAMVCYEEGKHYLWFRDKATGRYYYQWDDWRKYTSSSLSWYVPKSGIWFKESIGFGSYRYWKWDTEGNVLVVAQGAPDSETYSKSEVDALLGSVPGGVGLSSASSAHYTLSLRSEGGDTYSGIGGTLLTSYSQLRCGDSIEFRLLNESENVIGGLVVNMSTAATLGESGVAGTGAGEMSYVTVNCGDHTFSLVIMEGSEAGEAVQIYAMLSETEVSEGGVSEAMLSDYVKKAELASAKREVFVDLWEEACGSAGCFNAETGMFELNGITDISYEEAVVIYNNQFRGDKYSNGALYKFGARTNISKARGYGWFSLDLYIAFAHSALEVCRLPHPGESAVCTNQAAFAFCWSSKLRQVIGVLDLADVPSAQQQEGCFQGCAALESVAVKSLRHDFSFGDSPRLSLASLEYLVENAANTEGITVTLHPEAFARLTPELVSAAGAKRITFAEAAG